MASRRRLASVPEQPGRVVLYVRVSALMGRGGEDFHSPDLQIEAMRHAASTAGLREVCEPIPDIDVSGRSFSRGGLDRLKKLVENHQVDVVAVYDLSRLGRNLLESLQFIAWLREHNVAVMSSQERIDDTPEGQFMLGQYLNMAQLYSDQIGRRWKQVVKRRAQQGFHHSAPSLGYRYRRDEDGRPVKGVPIEPDPVVGPLMTEAFRRYAAGDPISHITDAVADGRGRHTAVTTIRRCLSNPIYTGKVVLWGVGRHRMPTVNDVPEFVGPGKHEALIDEETFERVQRRLRSDSKTAARHLAISHSLVGLVFCAHCEYHLQRHNDPKGTTVDGKKVPVPQFQCRSMPGSVRRGARCQGVGRPRISDVEDEVLRQLRVKLSRLQGNDAERAADLARRTREKTDADLLSAEIAEVRRKLKDTIRRSLETTSESTRTIIRELQDELEAQDRTLTEKLDRIQGEAVGAGHEMTFERFADLGATVLALWDDATIPERNRMLKAVVKQVVIRKADRWREPVASRVSVDFR